MKIEIVGPEGPKEQGEPVYLARLVSGSAGGVFLQMAQKRKDPTWVWILQIQEGGLRRIGGISGENVPFPLDDLHRAVIL